MPIIDQYNQDSNLELFDRLLGTSQGNTRNYSLQSIGEFFASRGIADPSKEAIVWQRTITRTFPLNRDFAVIQGTNIRFSEISNITVSNRAANLRSANILLGLFEGFVVKINATRSSNPSYGLYRLLSVNEADQEGYTDLTLEYIDGHDDDLLVPDDTVALSLVGSDPEGTITDEEIKEAYERNPDTNAFTDAEQSKLLGIENNATADQTGAEIKVLYEAEDDTNAFTDDDVSKLSGIEDNATADQTGTEIKTAYENNANTNAFTDLLLTKLNGIDTGATDDQTAAEIVALVNASLSIIDADNVADFPTSKITGLTSAIQDAIAARGDVVIYADMAAFTADTTTVWHHLDVAVVGDTVYLYVGTEGATSPSLANDFRQFTNPATAMEILTQLLTVDGTGSGLDADLLDGQHASEFATSVQGDLADSALQQSDVSQSTGVSLTIGTETFTPTVYTNIALEDLPDTANNNDVAFINGLGDDDSVIEGVYIYAINTWKNIANTRAAQVVLTTLNDGSNLSDPGTAIEFTDSRIGTSISSLHGRVLVDTSDFADATPLIITEEDLSWTRTGSVFTVTDGFESYIPGTGSIVSLSIEGIPVNSANISSVNSEAGTVTLTSAFSFGVSGNNLDITYNTGFADTVTRDGTTLNLVRPNTAGGVGGGDSDGNGITGGTYTATGGSVTLPKAVGSDVIINGLGTSAGLTLVTEDTDTNTVTVDGNLIIEDNLYISDISANDDEQQLDVSEDVADYAMSITTGNVGTSSIIDLSTTEGRAIQNALNSTGGTNLKLYIAAQNDDINQDEVVTAAVEGPFLTVFSLTEGANPTLSSITFEETVEGDDPVFGTGNLVTYTWFLAELRSENSILVRSNVIFEGDVSGIINRPERYSYASEDTIDWDEVPVANQNTDDTYDDPFHTDRESFRGHIVLINDISFDDVDVSDSATSHTVFTLPEATVVRLLEADPNTPNGLKRVGLHGVDEPGRAVGAVTPNQFVNRATSDGGLLYDPTDSSTVDADGNTRVRIKIFYRVRDNANEVIGINATSDFVADFFDQGNRAQIAEITDIINADQLAIIEENPLSSTASWVQSPGEVVAFENLLTETIFSGDGSPTIAGEVFRANIDESFTGLNFSSWRQLTYTTRIGLGQTQEQAIDGAIGVTSADQIFVEGVQEGALLDWITSDQAEGYIEVVPSTGSPAKVVARVNATDTLLVRTNGGGTETDLENDLSPTSTELWDVVLDLAWGAETAVDANTGEVTQIFFTEAGGTEVLSFSYDRIRSTVSELADVRPGGIVVLNQSDPNFIPITNDEGNLIDSTIRFRPEQASVPETTYDGLEQFPSVLTGDLSAIGLQTANTPQGLLDYSQISGSTRTGLTLTVTTDGTAATYTGFTRNFLASRVFVFEPDSGTIPISDSATTITYSLTVPETDSISSVTTIEGDLTISGQTTTKGDVTQVGLGISLTTSAAAALYSAIDSRSTFVSILDTPISVGGTSVRVDFEGEEYVIDVNADATRANLYLASDTTTSIFEHITQNTA